MRMFVTKSALTDGVYECEGKFSDYAPKKYFIPSNDWHSLRVGTECFESEQEAILKAETMRLNEIKKYKKKIKELTVWKIVVKHLEESHE
jgi:hypothetical protein